MLNGQQCLSDNVAHSTHIILMAESQQIKPALLTRPGLVSTAHQGIWQLRNIPINMQYCEEYLSLSSIKWNHFNGFLFGPCGSK